MQECSKVTYGRIKFHLALGARRGGCARQMTTGISHIHRWCGIFSGWFYIRAVSFLEKAMRCSSDSSIESISRTCSIFMHGLWRKLWCSLLIVLNNPFALLPHATAPSAKALCSCCPDYLCRPRFVISPLPVQFTISLGPIANEGRDFRQN